MASQFRLVFLAILSASLFALMICRFPLGIFIAGLGLLLNGIPIGAMYLPPVDVRAADQQVISILNFNTEFQHNKGTARFAEMISTRHPDIITLVEVDQYWLDRLEPKLTHYPFRTVSLTGPGLAVFSRFPLEQTEVRFYGKSHHPRIYSTVRLGRKALKLIVVHPPTPKAAPRYRERNRELSLIAHEVSELPSPTVLAGDLNCGPWSFGFGELLKAGLKDTQQGFGPQPSWPARPGRVMDGISIPPFVPIDHVLVSDDLRVIERTAGPSIGSDHLPVFVRLGIRR